MPSIVSVAEVVPPCEVSQDLASDFARELFGDCFKDIERLLNVFQNGQIEKRHFVKDMDWFRKNHTLEEKNDAFIKAAVTYGREAIERCLNSRSFLHRPIDYAEIDVIFFVSTTGLATPSIDARIMNQLPFHPHTKRVPIWGLGCAGGASGLSRAFEYCLAFPKAKVIVLSIELCSLTFQRNDLSKSNLIGTSLFADGIACALICGDGVDLARCAIKETSPEILAVQSTLMPNSLDVMGWDIKNDGLYVVFSRDIPNIIVNWLEPNVNGFLTENQLELSKIDYFIAHPGGKKVLDAYVEALGLLPEKTDISASVLNQFGNMSSATILYVLRQFMELHTPEGFYGLCIALGPGFSSEMLLLRWRK